MPSTVPDADVQQACDLVAKYGSAHAASLHSGVPHSTLAHRLRLAAKRGIEPSPGVMAEVENDRQSQIVLLRDQVKSLRAQVRQQDAQTVTFESVKRMIGVAVEHEPDPPKWLTPRKPSKASSGVPTLFLSDWHWGEVVNPAEIEGANEFNLEVAHKRARKLVERARALLFDYLSVPTYDGVVVALGGDMVSGDIHEELSKTNEVPIMPAVCDAIDVLHGIISAFADDFGKVFVPCVVGNHGRSTRKWQYKETGPTSFDWLIYQMLRQRFTADKRVTFRIPDGPDTYYRIYGHKYCLTHGNQFRGGDGLIGPLGPLTRGRHKKASRDASLSGAFDTMIVGHFHQLMQLPHLIVNGSLKGYDEFAFGNNFAWERPSQALWLTHPENGITFQMPVYLDDPRTLDKAAWVSVGG